MIKFYILLIFTAYSCDLFCQNLSDLPALPHQAEMADYSIMFSNWSKNKDSDQRKGWKWIARWIDDQQKNAGLDGLPPLTKEVYKGYKAYNQFKIDDAFASKRKLELWSPAGPQVAPTPIDSFLISGTGRINCITFHPTDSNTMWCGGGQGGIFKSINQGASWFPIGDDLPVLHVSDIAVDPINPDIIYASVGDYAYMATGLFLDDRKRHTHYGLGVYKTIDGGQTWKPTGLAFEQSEEDASLTRRVFIHPSQTNRLVAAGMQGIWTSEDAGETWTKRFDEIIWDIEWNQSFPDIIYATTGFLQTLNQGKASILKTTDFGVTWTTLQQIVPETDSVARMEIDVADHDPNIVYLVAANLYGGLAGVYRTLDGGETWDLMASEPNVLTWTDGKGISGQGWYDLAILIDPRDQNRIYIDGVNSWVSEDAGLTWSGASYYRNSFGQSVHADHHFLTYNNYDGKIYLCHDGGISRTSQIEAGSWEQAFGDPKYQWPTEWEHLNNGLANLSFYRLGISQNQAGNVFSGAQDMGTFLRKNEAWTYHSLGDGMECLIDSRDDQIMIGSSQFGNLFRSFDQGLTFQSLGGNPWRDNGQTGWTTPFLQMANNPEHLLVGGAQVFLSENDGMSFDQISNFSNPFPISAISYSEDHPNVIYVAKRLYQLGSVPSEVHVTFDKGASWEDITDGLPLSHYFSFLATDDDDPLHSWISCNGFDAQNKVFETFDGGQTWNNISYNLPNLPANCLLHQTGSADDIIYVGMDRGVYFKRTGEVYWTLYSEGLPNVIVTELEIQKLTEKLYISTFGRGIWMNDIVQDLQVSTDIDISSNLQIKVSPTISQSAFNIQIENDSKPFEARIEVIDIMGTTHFAINRRIDLGSNHIPIELNVLSGQYFIRVHNGNNMSVKKVMIVK